MSAESMRTTPAEDPVLTLEEIAGYLKVSEKTILRMVRAGELPGAKVSNQWRFLKAAIDDWLTARMSRTPSHDLVNVIRAKSPLLPVPHLVSPERVILDIKPAEKPQILEQLIAPLVDDGLVSDPSLYLATLIERENVISTAIGESVAVPHVHDPESSGLACNSMVIGICREGTDFGALDALPTRLFFLIGSVSTEAHLRLMAKTMLLLRVPGLKKGLIEAATREEVRELLIEAHRDLSIRL